MNIRVDVANKLRDALPGSWLVVDHATALDNPQAPVILVRQMTVARHPGAPRLYREVGFTIALVEPGLAPDKVENALDADIELVIDALETIDVPGLVWTGADRVTFDDRFHGYDIAVTVTTEKE